MDPGTHFAFGTHEQHCFVAAFASSMPAHLAHWFLVREQFEPVPDQPGRRALLAGHERPDQAGGLLRDRVLRLDKHCGALHRGHRRLPYTRLR